MRLDFLGFHRGVFGEHNESRAGSREPVGGRASVPTMTDDRLRRSPMATPVLARADFFSVSSPWCLSCENVVP